MEEVRHTVRKADQRNYFEVSTGGGRLGSNGHGIQRGKRKRILDADGGDKHESFFAVIPAQAGTQRRTIKDTGFPLTRE